MFQMSHVFDGLDYIYNLFTPYCQPYIMHYFQEFEPILWAGVGNSLRTWSIHLRGEFSLISIQQGVDITSCLQS